METEKKPRERVRKENIRHGQKTQRMVNFRCDNENVEWLKTKANKGRYINELIAADRDKSQEPTNTQDPEGQPKQ